MNPYRESRAHCARRARHDRSTPSGGVEFLIYGVVLLVALLVLCGENAFSQQRVQVIPTSYTTFTDYDSNGNPVYICQASVTQSNSLFSVGYANLTSITVEGTVGTVNFVNAHGFLPGYRLTISGSATTALNGTYRVLTADPAATSLTITTIGVPSTAYTDVTISTDTALLTKPVWAIRYFYWSGGNNLFTGWTNGNRDGYNQICANRAVINGANVVTFK